MVKRFAMLGVAGLAFLGSACAKDDAVTTAPTTTAAAPSSSTTAAATGDTTTTSPSAAKTPVTKPVKVEKIDQSKLPAAAREKPKNFDLSTDEGDCVDTVVYSYSQDPSNATDAATLSGVQGGAIAACVDQDKTAEAIVLGVKQSAPTLTTAQATCLKNEIATTDKESLAIFLGAFIYEGPEAADLQKPFIDALSKACKLG